MVCRIKWKTEFMSMSRPHTHTSSFSCSPDLLIMLPVHFLLDQLVQVMSNVTAVFCWSNFKFIQWYKLWLCLILLHSVLQNSPTALMERGGKKPFLSRKRGLDGAICICEIYSLGDDSPTSPTPFPFAAAVLSATHEGHWNQPCMLGVRCEIWGLYKMFHQLEPWVHTCRTAVRHISCTESDAIMSSLNFHIIWKIRVIVQYYHSRYESVGESKQNKRSRLGRTVSPVSFLQMFSPRQRHVSKRQRVSHPGSHDPVHQPHGEAGRMRGLIEGAEAALAWRLESQRGRWSVWIHIRGNKREEQMLSEMLGVESTWVITEEISY